MTTEAGPSPTTPLRPPRGEKTHRRGWKCATKIDTNPQPPPGLKKKKINPIKMQKRGRRIEERRMNSVTPPDPERAAPALCEPLPPCACPTIRAAAWNGAGCCGGEGKGAESNLFTPHNVLFEQTPKENGGGSNTLPGGRRRGMWGWGRWS